MNSTWQVKRRLTRWQHMAEPGEPPENGPGISQTRSKCYTMLRRKFEPRIRRTGPAALHDRKDDPDKTDISRARSRSRPLHRGRDRSCRTGLRTAVAEIHADPPPGATGAVVQPPPARRL